MFEHIVAWNMDFRVALFQTIGMVHSTGICWLQSLPSPVIIPYSMSYIVGGATPTAQADFSFFSIHPTASFHEVLCAVMFLSASIDSSKWIQALPKGPLAW